MTGDNQQIAEVASAFKLAYIRPLKLIQEDDISRNPEPQIARNITELERVYAPFWSALPKRKRRKLDSLLKCFNEEFEAEKYDWRKIEVAKRKEVKSLVLRRLQALVDFADQM